jgi:hypothetical protein
MESKVRRQDLNELEIQIADIETRFKGNRHVEYLVKMIRAISWYLASWTDNAHAHGAHGQIVLVLGSLVDELGIILKSPGISSMVADEVLARAFQSFKALKSSISAAPLVSQRDIEELKSVILSIDWEISDLTLQSFDAVVKRLMKKVKSNKIHSSFLKMILSIGGYVAKNKESSHRGALGLLRTVFQDYESMVQNPGMTASEKKQLIELDIRKFHEFKRELGRSPGKAAAQEPDAEEIMPALSHVKSSPLSAHGEDLSKLSDEGVSPSDFHDSVHDSAHDLAADQDQEITPALMGKKKGLTDSRDMMDDLFAAKGSESDDLLDAIHLGGINGAGPQKAKGMALFETPDDRDEQKQEGFKHFTPKRGEQEPIPEIESRLEEFFNLEFTEEELEPALQTITPTSQDVQVNDQVNIGEYDQEPESIVPFQYEDEIFEEDEVELFAVDEEFDKDEDEVEHGYEDGYEDGETDKSSIQDEEEKNRVPATLDSLKTFLITPEGFKHKADLTGFIKKISVLEQEWQGDSDKLSLLEMIILLARHVYDLGNQSSTVSEYEPEPPLEATADKWADLSKEKKADSTVEEEDDLQVPAERGLWARVRSMFRKP